MGVPKLVIGNKNYSSWSLRAWLILTKLGIEFEEVLVPLFSDGYKEELLRYSPTGKVPAYLEDKLVIWDTLAIAEYLAEQHPVLWPREVEKRAQARSISARRRLSTAAIGSAARCRLRRLSYQSSPGSP